MGLATAKFADKIGIYWRDALGSNCLMGAVGAVSNGGRRGRPRREGCDSRPEPVRFGQ